jgi:hypothetical protein
MVTETNSSSAVVAGEGTKRQVWKAVILGAIGLGVAAFVLLSAERGPVSPGTRNPEGWDRPPPVTPFLNGIDWVGFGQVMAVVLFGGTVVGVLWGWRRHPRHPVLLMVVASNTLCWFDPINNWAIGLVYNPELWHFPQDWPWVGMSPIIEPLTSFVYAPYVLLPCLLSMPTLRWLQKNRRPDAIVWRRPLISLGLITFCFAFVWD